MTKTLVMSLVVLLSFVFILAEGCTNDKYDKLYPVSGQLTVTCDTTNISYSKDIVPILTNYCYSPNNGCHDVAGSSTSGFDFTTYNGVAPVAQSGILLDDITWAPGNNQMPKNGSKLSDCDIEKFTRWINQGALNN